MGPLRHMQMPCNSCIGRGPAEVIRIRNWMLLGGLLAALGFISPVIAAVVMATSSLFGVRTTLRLCR
jgi:hypothetical protein